MRIINCYCKQTPLPSCVVFKNNTLLPLTNSIAVCLLIEISMPYPRNVHQIYRANVPLNIYATNKYELMARPNVSFGCPWISLLVKQIHSLFPFYSIALSPWYSGFRYYASELCIYEQDASYPVRKQQWLEFYGDFEIFAITWVKGIESVRSAFWGGGAFHRHRDVSG